MKANLRIHRFRSALVLGLALLLVSATGYAQKRKPRGPMVWLVNDHQPTPQRLQLKNKDVLVMTNAGKKLRFVSLALVGDSIMVSGKDTVRVQDIASIKAKTKTVTANQVLGHTLNVVGGLAALAGFVPGIYHLTANGNPNYMLLTAPGISLSVVGALLTGARTYEKSKGWRLTSSHLPVSVK